MIEYNHMYGDSANTGMTHHMYGDSANTGTIRHLCIVYMHYWRNFDAWSPATT